MSRIREALNKATITIITSTVIFRLIRVKGCSRWAVTNKDSEQLEPNRHLSNSSNSLSNSNSNPLTPTTSSHQLNLKTSNSSNPHSKSSHHSSNHSSSSNSSHSSKFQTICSMVEREDLSCQIVCQEECKISGILRLTCRSTKANP